MFYIIEQGARIQTPLESLVRMKRVNALEGMKSITATGGDQPSVADKQLVGKEGIKNYQQTEEQAEQRQPAMFAHQIMTQPVISIDMGESIASARQLLEQQRFHHLPVVDNNKKLCGIISDRDIMRYSLQHQAKDLARTAVDKAMTIKVITAAETTEIRSIADVMCQQGFSAMPITDKAHNLMGIVSRTDILRTLVNEEPLELWV
ncbi:HPP family protein [Oceanicoccus sp. KOV_DT_Chl]|uniref:CBS domain-containing protein n=1 Tax=Oceanicoccus sp. KOV_DT_Chl TaxID=1904639 RepID=UPI00135BE4D8|nr:CBS domain-containing protein [Oceanicoccus sp. KOV_DT_Chl]